jgi:uncharacterized membrane protein (UPF0127 family)
MKPRTALFAAAIGLGLLFYVIMPRLRQSDCDTRSITMPNGTSFSAEIADTTPKRIVGLSHRRTLPEHSGMLFLFDQPGIYPFWMKGTLIPLDIVWLSDKQVVDRTSLGPEQGPNIPSYTPKQIADTVIEMNRGEAEKFHLTIGSHVTWADCQK